MKQLSLYTKLPFELQHWTKRALAECDNLVFSQGLSFMACLKGQSTILTSLSGELSHKEAYEVMEYAFKARANDRNSFIIVPNPLTPPSILKG